MGIMAEMKTEIQVERLKCRTGRITKAISGNIRAKTYVFGYMVK